MIGQARVEASKTECKLNQQTKLINSQMNGGHGFIMATPGGNVVNTSPLNLMSAAKRDLPMANNYK